MAEDTEDATATAVDIIDTVAAALGAEKEMQ